MAPAPEDEPGRSDDRSTNPGAAEGAETSDEYEEDEVDEASEESFPASDAPASWSGPPSA